MVVTFTVAYIVDDASSWSFDCLVLGHLSRTVGATLTHIKKRIYLQTINRTVLLLTLITSSLNLFNILNMVV